MKDIYFYMMVGLQGSGKSTYVKQQPKENNHIFSADSWRENYPEEKNDRIFEMYYGEINYYLDICDANSGINESPESFYLDNTHCQFKARRTLFDHIKRWKKIYPTLNFHVIALVMTTPYDICLQRIKERQEKTGKVIPEEVLKRYRDSFCMPIVEEGFEDIKLIDGNTLTEISGEINCDPPAYLAIRGQMLEFNQENPHHAYSLGVHMHKTEDLVFERREQFLDFANMHIAAGIHDWGKFYTKTYNEQGVARYYNHGQVGAYELLSHLELIPYREKTVASVCRIIAYVNYHMRPFDWNTEKALAKAKKELGESMVHDLIIFNQCDKAASGTESELKE